MNQNIQFMFSTFFAENRAVDEIMLKIMIEPEKATDDNIIRRMRILCWIAKFRIHTHTLNI